MTSVKSRNFVYVYQAPPPSPPPGTTRTAPQSNPRLKTLYFLLSPSASLSLSLYFWCNNGNLILLLCTRKESINYILFFSFLTLILSSKFHLFTTCNAVLNHYKTYFFIQNVILLNFANVILKKTKQ